MENVKKDEKEMVRVSQGVIFSAKSRKNERE